LSLTLDDVRGMTEFGLALGGQISEADKISTGKLIFECIIGGALLGTLIALMAANYSNKTAKRDNTLDHFQPIQLPELHNAETNADLRHWSGCIIINKLQNTLLIGIGLKKRQWFQNFNNLLKINQINLSLPLARFQKPL